jgi:type VI secretion system protein ImpB
VPAKGLKARSKLSRKVKIMAKRDANQDLKKSRVNISTTLDKGDAIQKPELHFVTGVLSDLSFDSTVQKADLTKRGFEEVTKENFDQYMSRVKPAVTFEVPNKLDASGGTIPVRVTFNEIGHFSPAEVAKQIPPCRELIEQRQRFKDLLGELTSPEFQGEFKRLLAALEKSAQPKQG